MPGHALHDAGPDAGSTETKESILVLDRDPGLQFAFVKHLESWSERCLLAEDAQDLLAKMDSEPEVCAVFLNIAAPGMHSVDLLEAIGEKDPETAVVLMTDYLDPSLALSLLKNGAFDYIRKPFLFEEIRVLLHRIREHRALRSQALALQVLQETKRVERQNLIDFMIGLANVIDAKSPYTKEHSDRVALMTKAFTRHLGLSEKEIEDISFGAKLHDIGKVGIPDRILEATGRLSKEDRQLMNDHPVTGAKILEPIEVMRDIIPMVLRHHENWDGSGYPDGLKGEEVPLGARIVKIVDYFDAITSKRPYREPLPDMEAIQVLEAERGRILDPSLTDRFIELIRKGGLRQPKVSGVLPAVRL